MKSTFSSICLFAAIVVAASLLLPDCREQKKEPVRTAFQEISSKAEAGDATFQFILAGKYSDGEGVDKNPTKAVEWYRKAAAQNHARAQSALGSAYQIGRGVEKDYREAVRWFREAAAQNNLEAQCSLGGCYRFGHGVEPDYKEAVKWFRKAAERNYVVAQWSLGNCYYQGDGVEKDYVEAYAWLNLAAWISESVAKERDSLEIKMSRQQIEAGQKRTQELKAEIEARRKSSDN